MTPPQAALPKPRRRRLLRWALAALAVLVLLPAAGLAAFLLTFDPDAQKPRIEAAVRNATGRDLAIAGPIGVKPALRPTITLQDVELANPPGFSRPAMLSLRRAEVRLAVLPLLSRRVEIDRVLLDGADLLLERDAAGRPNWVFARPQPPATAPQPPSQPAAPAARPLEIAFDEVLLTGSRLGWRAGPDAAARELAVTRLAIAPRGADRALRIDGAAVLDGLALTLEGESGPAAALLAGTPAPWPLRLAVAGEGGLAVSVEGNLTPPAGYRLAVTARVPELARLAPLLPDAPLPPLRGVEAAAVLAAGVGGGPPELSGLRLVLGESALNAVLPGLVLDSAVFTLAAPDQPLGLEVAARIGAVPVTLAGTLGAPLALLEPAGPPWPVDLRAAAGAARLTLAGTVADPRAGTGIDLMLTATVPELAALAPLVPPDAPALPPLREVSLAARIAERGARFAEGVELRELRLASSAGDLAGALSVATRPRPAVTGQLAGSRLDIDALRAAPTASAPMQAAPLPGPPATAPAGAPAAPSDRRVIPDLALPLEALRLADADLRLAVQALRAGGLDWGEVSAHAVLREGRGRLDPLAATLAGAGRITLRAAADISTTPPTVQVALRGEGLDLRGIPAAGGATGRLGIEADLRGGGRDLRALAAGAFGHLGLTLQDGSLPPSLLEGALAGLRQRVPGLDGLLGQPLVLGCVVARLEAREGIAAARVLLAETGLGRIGAEGAGAINLRDETLALRLNTDLRLPVPGLGAGGLRIRAPVPVTGTLAAPRPEWNAVAGSAIAGEVANQAERALGQGAGQLLGALGGAIAGARDAGGGPVPDCAAALAIARGGQAPATPPAAPPAAAAEAPRPGGVARDLPAPAQELLRRLPLPGLFGR